jgi:teichuronic acid biosynthesis glycosyltransferase TuaG
LKFSIIIPVFNRFYLLEKTLESIKCQQYENFECIVINDYSSEQNFDVISELYNRDLRFIFINNIGNKGVQYARSQGLRIANGDFVCFFDSDNLMYENCLSEVSKFILLNNKVDVVTFYAHVADSDDNIVDVFNWHTDGNIFHSLIAGNTYVDNNNSFIKRSLLLQIGELSFDCPSFQEFDLHLRLSKSSFYGTCEIFLVRYYRRGANTISSNYKLRLDGQIYIFEKFYNGSLEVGKTLIDKKLIEIFHEARGNYFLLIRSNLSLSFFQLSSRYFYWLVNIFLIKITYVFRKSNV